MTLRAFAVATAFASLLATGAAAAERTVTLKVEGMTCALCGPTVKKSLERVPGVAKVRVDSDKEIAVVVFDDAKADIEALTKATTNAGYPSRLAQ
ncbi:MAG: mercury resistance system periplasmic binding protein MerP [Rhodomicrobium sp.]|nr:mercury resistance system periplasmic binding protein MerP [Rhodomicrobium sp.]